MHLLPILRLWSALVLSLAASVSLPGQAAESKKPAQEGGLSWDVPAKGVKLNIAYPGWQENTKEDEVLGAYFDHVESGEEDLTHTTLLSLGIFPALAIGPNVEGVIKVFQAEPDLYTDLKLEGGQRIGGVKDAFLITWRVNDPKTPSSPKLNSMYLWLVDGHLYQWIERVPKAHYAEAQKMLAKARRTLKARGPKGALHFPKTHNYVNQRVSYTLPAGWRWMNGSQGEKVTTDKTLLDQVLYEYADGLKVGRVVAQIIAQGEIDPTGKLLDYHAGFADGVLKSFSDPKDAKAQKSARVAGKKGCRTWLTAKTGETRFALAFASFFHHSYLIHFMTLGDTAGQNQARKALKAAEKGLKILP